MAAASATISGKGAPNRKMARKDAAARPSMTLFFRARLPMRNTACSTIASTAAFSPKNSAVTTGTSP